MDFTKIIESLEKKGYTVKEFQTKEEAAAYMNTAIDGKSVGIGGSVTVHEMGLFPLLNTHNTVYWHHEKPENMSVNETRIAAMRSQIYISSVNGIAETGEIINIDGGGNRVAGTSFGPEKIFYVTGENKIAPDMEKAIWRARNIASPLNAQRLGRKTPCAVNGDKCYDCSSPERICCNMQILLKKPMGAQYEVVLIHESLGY